MKRLYDWSAGSNERETIRRSVECQWAWLDSELESSAFSIMQVSQMTADWLDPSPQRVPSGRSCLLDRRQKF